MARSRRQFRLGEDLAVCLDVMDGEFSSVTAISGRLRRVMSGCGKDEFDPMDQGRSMLVFQQQVAPGGLPGWLFLLPAAETAGLSPGDYGVDARMVLAGGALAVTRKSAYISLTDGAVR